MPSPYEQGVPVRMVPCTVTSTSPLVITVFGFAGVPAVKIAGATYSLGVANALILPVGKPVVLPIG